MKLKVKLKRLFVALVCLISLTTTSALLFNNENEAVVSEVQNFSEQFKYDINETLYSSDIETYASPSDDNGTYVALLATSIVSTTILVGLGAYGGYKLFEYYYNRRNKLSMFLDKNESMKNGKIVFNIINVDRFEEIYNSHEDELILYAANMPLKAKFRKDGTYRNSYRIYIEDLMDTNVKLFKYTVSLKRSEFTIGIKGSSVVYPVTQINDDRVDSYSKKNSLSPAELYEVNKQYILSLFEKEEDREAAVKSPSGNIILINKNKTTPTSIRYKVLLTPDDIFIQGVKDLRTEFNMYYIYDGKAYPLKTRFISQAGTLVEFDLYDLEPGTIYTGLSFSPDGKVLIPSAALYATTRDEDGDIVTKTDAKLAKGNGQDLGLPMWDLEQGKKAVGELSFKRSLDVLIKKHYEDENKDAYVIANKAEQFYDEYLSRWIKDYKGYRN